MSDISKWNIVGDYGYTPRSGLIDVRLVNGSTMVHVDAAIVDWKQTGKDTDAFAWKWAAGSKPETKESNPKDTAGSARIDLSLLDPLALADMALAMEEGRTKYGAYNYKVVGVKARTYVSAAMRHLLKYLMGEDRDPKTGVHHLGSAMACCMVVLSAYHADILIDDRPPSTKDASSKMDEFEARVKHVREVFKDFNPKHYTIKDVKNGDTTGEQKNPGGQ